MRRSVMIVYVKDLNRRDLASCIGGLNIGCGMNSAAGIFWSDLIDYIRIYNRAVSPLGLSHSNKTPNVVEELTELTT